MLCAVRKGATPLTKPGLLNNRLTIDVLTVIVALTIDSKYKISFLQTKVAEQRL